MFVLSKSVEYGEKVGKFCINISVPRQPAPSSPTSESIYFQTLLFLLTYICFIVLCVQVPLCSQMAVKNITKHYRYITIVSSLQLPVPLYRYNENRSHTTRNYISIKLFSIKVFLFVALLCKLHL